MKRKTQRAPRREGTGSRLVSTKLKDSSSRFYTVARDGSSITCLVCGFTSSDPGHVRDKFCPRCMVFHEDRSLMERLAEGYQKHLPAPEEEPTWLKLAA